MMLITQVGETKVEFLLEEENGNDDVSKPPLDDRNDRYNSDNKAPNLDDGVESLSNEDASEFERCKIVMIVNVTTEENGQPITNLWWFRHTQL